MGQAFSGPDAFKFLRATPEATAVLQADPFLFVTLLLVLFSCTSLILVAWYIHFVTNKVYKKPKPDNAKAQSVQKSTTRLAPWVTR